MVRPRACVDFPIFAGWMLQTGEKSAIPSEKMLAKPDVVWHYYRVCGV
jgi:hypothetical protein